MTEEGRPDSRSHIPFPAGLLWDQSLVWGLICVETLKSLDVPFRVLSAQEIASGALGDFRVLIVPGGWAAHKVKALGRQGRTAVARFVDGGGSYLGFCGGAGLALASPPSLGLVPLERLPLSERLPNASGEVIIRGRTDHSAWQDLPPSLPVSIWWPSQFRNPSAAACGTLAVYERPGRDFRVADLPIDACRDSKTRWEVWEKSYGINLDPRRILGHPAVIEVERGKGRLVLSYPHLETPGDLWGNRLFANLLQYLDQQAAAHLPLKNPGQYAAEPDAFPETARPCRETLERLEAAHREAEELIRFGEENLLWSWRRSWLLQWQRGIRGLEYGTLAVSLRFLCREISSLDLSDKPVDAWRKPAVQIQRDVADFCQEAKRLLLEEKAAGQNANLSKLQSVNPTVDALRARLFGSGMSHGGFSRRIFDTLDAMLLNALRRWMPVQAWADGLSHRSGTP
ncbi:BPL-N domain-containing protein [Desulfoglaeba alkanexedens]|uniref:Biotin-protein ligase N-terminal domain-containing protein n=1 Tax=Desulfoglaeba alkanexedens ALDC TaxID=980445 RepID=A0A4V1ERR4_9BACT|nr:BPL-N domain-containing protein [Desulfoglaeba alkanexedens]QCQ22551.1 hypothetical protein FDQ92_10475 [Desulfoglaeba alkanexedens ALDC]